MFGPLKIVGIKLWNWLFPNDPELFTTPKGWVEYRKEFPTESDLRGALSRFEAKEDNMNAAVIVPNGTRFDLVRVRGAALIRSYARRRDAVRGASRLGLVVAN